MFKPKKVVIVGADYPVHEKYCSNMNGMQTGLKKLGIEFKFVSCRPSLDVKEVISFKPDLIVYVLRDVLENQKWHQEIVKNRKGAKIVMWYGDFRDIRNQVETDASDLDCLFVSNDAQELLFKTIWKARRVEFLPLGCEPIDKPVFNEKLAFPFVFVGGFYTDLLLYRSRTKLIQEFIKNDDLKLIDSQEPSLRAMIMKKMPEIYSSSKISLDISHSSHTLRYTSNRYWIIPAYWGFALTRRFPGCEEFYPESIRAYFDTYEEAVEKLKYYTEHEDERRKMIIASHLHSLNHTYDKRWNQMFKLLSQ